MYYVVRKGEDITMYLSAWTNLYTAKIEADYLKATFNREYEVLRMELVYATLTLRNLEK